MRKVRRTNTIKDGDMMNFRLDEVTADAFRYILRWERDTSKAYRMRNMSSLLRWCIRRVAVQLGWFPQPDDREDYSVPQQADGGVTGSHSGAGPVDATP